MDCGFALQLVCHHGWSRQHGRKVGWDIVCESYSKLTWVLINKDTMVMFFRSIIPDARHWSRCWTASAVQWVGLLVVVRWKTSKAFMLVFLFCRRHFESGDLFVLAAAVVRLKLRNAIIVRLYLGDWKHLLRPPCLLVIAIAASKAANCLYIAIISRWLKASLASTLPSLVIAMTLALSRATHIQRHFAYYISHETILICVLDPVSMPFSSDHSNIITSNIIKSDDFNPTL